MDLEEYSIAELRGMLAAAPPDSDDAAGLTEELAAALVGRYESGALPADAAGRDLDEAIALTTGLLARHDDADGVLGAHLIQAAAHYYRAGAGDEPAELDAAISRLEAVAGRLDDEELAPDVLVMLGDCLTARYRNALPGAPLEETDLSAAIDAYERASRLAAEDDPAMITVAYELAGLHQQRYLARAARGHSGARADLDEAIGCFRRVLAAVAAGLPADSGSGEDERAFYEQLAEEVTVRLGLVLADRVLQHGNAPADVDEAIARLEAVVPAAGDPFRPLAAVYRGVMLGVRFTMHRGDPADRGTAITVLREALAGADSPDRGQVEGDAGYVDPTLADTARLWLGQLLILGDVPAELRAGVPPAAFDLRQAAQIGSRMAATATRDEADEAIGQLSKITTLPGTGDEGEGEATIAMLLGTALVIRGATGMPDGDLDRIIGLFGRAAQLTRPDALGGPELTAMHAWLLGERANRPGRADDIEPAAEALTRARALLPASHPMTPFVLYHFAATVGRRGMHRSYAPDVTAAIEALSEALVAMPDDHPMRTQALSLLGAAMLSGAQFDLTALPLGRLIEVLGQALERPDADPVSLAVRLCCLGQATHLQAIRSRAQDGFTRAVDYVKQADGLLPADHRLRAFVLFTLATMLADQYSFTSALESLTASAYYLDRMEEVLESSNAPAYDPDGNSFASVYATRGSVRMMLAHRHEDALLFRQAIADLERALSLYPANHTMRPRLESELATATMGLAILERDPRRLAEGLAGLAAPAETVAVDHPDFASLHGRAGLMLVSQAWMTGDGRALDDGVVSLRKAVAYAGLGEGERARLRWGLGFALAHRYDVSRDVADLDQGIEELEQARRELVRGPGDGAAIHVLAQLAHAYRKRADPARGDLRQATETGLAALREQASGVLLQTGTERALMMARVAAADAAEVASWALDDGRPEAAVEALELGRALVLHAATAAVDLPALLRESGFPALAAEWESRNAATAQAEGEASPATPWDQAAGAAGREARSIEARSAEALLAELPGVTPDDLRNRTLQALAGGPAQARLLSPPGLGEIRDAMTVTGTDLVAYLIPAGGYGPGRAVVVGGGAVTEIPLRALACGPGSPAERYAAAQQEANRDRRAENNTDERAVSTLARLCDWAWAAAVGPLLDAVADPDPHLVLIPLGLLGVVPWHAARWYDQAGAPHYAVEQATFSYAASARQFADLARREPLTDPARAVLVGVASDQTPFMNIEASEIRDSFYPEGLLLRAREPTRATAERVLGWLPGRDAEGASLLHLSCHATTGASPDRSYLQLAGGDELRIDRILRRAHGRPAGAPGGLVILAACVSDLTPRDYDEALTLATAFLAAGAVGVLGSRWRVPDRHTALLMFMFHHHLAAGRPAAEALRCAQVWMLSGDRQIPAEMPGVLADEVRGEGRLQLALDEVMAWAAFTYQGTDVITARTAHMTLPFAVETLAEYWDEVVGLLSEQQWHAVRTRIQELLDSDDADIRSEVATDLLQIVASVVPSDHPVRRALVSADAVRSTRKESGRAYRSQALSRLRARLDADDASRTGSSQPPQGGTGGPGWPGPGWPAQDARADGSSGGRRRYLKGQCPESVSVGTSFSLLVNIVLTPNAGHAPLKDFSVPPAGRDILLVAHAPGLHMLSDQQQSVSVPADDDSEPVKFEFRADTPGPRQVSVTAWIGGTYLGELRAEITAAHDSRDGGTHRDVLAEIATEPTEGAVSLVVRYDPAHQTYRFEFRDEDNPAEVTSHLAYDPGPIVERLVAELDDLARSGGGYAITQTRDYLVNAGARLWHELVPGTLREQFWDRQHRIRQLTILADRDTVPWELLYPRDAGHNAGFLVEQFPVTRALFGRRLGRKLDLWPPRFVLADGSLPQARHEIDAIRRLLDPEQPPANVISDLKPLQELIHNGDFGLLHFACHNGFDIRRGSSITMDSGLFTPTLMTTAAIDQVLGRAAPTIFMNACRSAGLAATYNRLDGWASKFLEAGATAFIGSLWTVRDQTAREFAEEFYRQLHGGCPLGEAMMRARRMMAADRPDDPTWLAYTVYGNPSAMIGGPRTGPA